MAVYSLKNLQKKVGADQLSWHYFYNFASRMTSTAVLDLNQAQHAPFFLNTKKIWVNVKGIIIATVI